jgi:hypothetical protein
MNRTDEICRIASGVAVAQLAAAINRQPWLFGQHGLRAYTADSPHQKMTDIWVRYNDINHLDTADPAGFHAEHESVWYPEYYALPQLRPIIFDLMSFVEGERLGGVLVTKLPAGGRIERHVDGGWHASYYDKFYVAVQNEKGATFNFEGACIDPNPGDVYWFDNSKPHWVINDSEQDRIALIVCIKTHRFGAR